MAEVYEQPRGAAASKPAHARRPGVPAWAWPLIPLVLGALALGLSLRGANDQRAGSSQPTAGNAVTDMLTVVNAADKSTFVGRPAEFANVKVQNVTGNRSFWIGPNKDQQLFVVADDPSNGGPPAAAAQVQSGQNVTVSGVIEQLQGAAEAQKTWGLDAANSAQLAKQGMYVRAKQITGAR